VLTIKALDNIVSLLKKNNKAGRESISGLNRDRADVILAGAVILQQLMKQSNFEEVSISGQGLREGLFYEHFLSDQEKPLLPDVRTFSVQNLANLFDYEAVHTAKVRELSLSLFDQLQPLHGYGTWERDMLAHAALLHDIGIQVGYYDHHKHSAYLLVNAPPPGFTHREVALLTILVRSHRKGSVKTGEYSAVLASDDDERAARLGALLRLSEDLERSKSQVVQHTSVEFERDIVRLKLHTQGEAIAELWNVNQRTGLFEKAFGRKLEVVRADE
jgi:exopolyphosphatase/guanosine-5'-triphosphate,3'-diphosphate pyrophosphatase